MIPIHCDYCGTKLPRSMGDSDTEPPIGAFFGGMMAGVLMCGVGYFMLLQTGFVVNYKSGYADGRAQAHQDIADFCEARQEAEGDE